MSNLNINKPKKVTVKFETLGGSKIGEARVNQGADFTLPKNPVKKGYKFAGWYQDAYLTIPYASNVVEENITLYAKWSVGLSGEQINDYYKSLRTILSAKAEIAQGYSVGDGQVKTFAVLEKGTNVVNLFVAEDPQKLIQQGFEVKDVRKTHPETPSLFVVASNHEMLMAEKLCNLIVGVPMFTEVKRPIKLHKNESSFNLAFLNNCLVSRNIVKEVAVTNDLKEASEKRIKSKLQFATGHDVSHDKRFDTKAKSYFQDAFYRFSRNKGSVVAAIVILLLVVYSIIGPFFVDKGYEAGYLDDVNIERYRILTPKISAFEGTGFWDGTKKKEISKARYERFLAQEIETGHKIIHKVYGTETTTNFGVTSTLYTVRYDTYTGNDPYTVTLNKQQYEELLNWQIENDIQVILPFVKNSINSTIPNVWFKSDNKGNPIYDKDGNFQPDYYTKADIKPGTVIVDDGYYGKRIASDPGNKNPDSPNAYLYAKVTGANVEKQNYNVRIDAYNYFLYKYDFEPSFIFGTDAKGYDIFSRLASGARFSFLFAIAISAINLVIGAIYGAIEGYYGGVVDMVMERISDILSGIPFTVVTVLFKLHLADKVGLVPTLIFAFVLTGWIGMASRVRMQFYRFKNQEYILAARTLGAKDRRIMFKHIFPNALGTIVTGSVLVIPGVIFSETSLTYLKIVDLDSATMSSVGSMLSAGQGVMTEAPHALVFPAVFISLLMICFNLFGNGLRDAFNPSLRGTED